MERNEDDDAEEFEEDDKKNDAGIPVLNGITNSDVSLTEYKQCIKEIIRATRPWVENLISSFADTYGVLYSQQEMDELEKINFVDLEARRKGAQVQESQAAPVSAL